MERVNLYNQVQSNTVINKCDVPGMIWASSLECHIFFRSKEFRKTLKTCHVILNFKTKYFIYLSESTVVGDDEGEEDSTEQSSSEASSHQAHRTPVRSPSPTDIRNARFYNAGTARLALLTYFWWIELNYLFNNSKWARWLFPQGFWKPNQ